MRLYRGYFLRCQLMNRKVKGFLPLLEDYFTIYLPYSCGLSTNTTKSYKQGFLLLLPYLNEKKNIKADAVIFVDLNYEMLLYFFNWGWSKRETVSGLQETKGCQQSRLFPNTPRTGTLMLHLYSGQVLIKSC